MFNDSEKRHRFALHLMQAGVGRDIVCKAAGLSTYEYQILLKESRPLIAIV